MGLDKLRLFYIKSDILPHRYDGWAVHGKGQQIVRGTAPSLCPSDANIWNNQLLGEMSWGFWDENDFHWAFR